MSAVDLIPDPDPVEDTPVLDVLSPEERPLLLTVFSFFPGRDLLAMFRKHFEKRRHLAPLITKKPLNKVQLSDILEKLDRLVEVDPAFVETVVEGFKAVHEEVPASDADPQLRWAWNRLMGMEEASSTTADLIQDLREAQAEVSRLKAELELEKKRTLQQEKRIQTLQESQLQQTHQWEKKLLASHAKELQQLKGEIEVWKTRHEQLDHRLKQQKKESQDQKLDHQNAVKALNLLLEGKQQEILRNARELRDLRTQGAQQQQLTTVVAELKMHAQTLEREKHHLEMETRQLSQEIDRLQQQNITATPLDADALNKTLILNYQAFGTSALERLSHLIQGYDACLNKRFRDPRLLKASNSSQFVSKKPKHLLLLGVEEMLYDAVSLRLHHLLASRLMKQHEVLSQLMPQTDKLVEVQE